MLLLLMLSKMVSIEARDDFSVMGRGWSLEESEKEYNIAVGMKSNGVK